MVGAQRPDGGRRARSSSALVVYGFSRVPTGFLPIEDQGYLLATCSCPTAPRWSAPRTCSTRCRRSPARRPASHKVITIAGISALDNNATLANAGVAYLILKDWSVRGKQGQDLLPLFTALNKKPRRHRGGAHPRAAAAADPGHRQRRRLHHADRAARRQLRFRQAAERRPTRSSPTPRRRSGCSASCASFRADGAAIHDRGRPGQDRDAAASTSTRCSRRSAPISARPTSTSSTSSAAPSRSMCRRDAQFRLRAAGHREPDGAQPATAT